LQTEEPCNAVTATEEELEILEQYPYGFSFFNEEVALDSPGTILGCASHVERVDVLCNAIIGEMLIDDSPRLNHKQLATAKIVLKSPRGVAEAAEMWSDLDTTDDSGCEWCFFLKLDSADDAQMWLCLSPRLECGCCYLFSHAFLQTDSDGFQRTYLCDLDICSLPFKRLSARAPRVSGPRTTE